MGGLPPVTGVARCELLYSWDGQTVENVWFVSGADNSAGTLAAIADEMMGNWRTLIRPVVSELVVLDRAEVTYLGTANGNSIVRAAPADSNGQETSPPLPNNVSICVKLLTDQGGRAHRGRKFHIGLCENQVTLSHLIEPFRTQLETAYQGWISEMQAAEWSIVIVSYFVNGLIRPTPLVTAVNTCTIDATIDSQRRRLPGRGT